MVGARRHVLHLGLSLFCAVTNLYMDLSIRQEAQQLKNRDFALLIGKPSHKNAQSPTYAFSSILVSRNIGIVRTEWSNSTSPYMNCTLSKTAGKLRDAPEKTYGTITCTLPGQLPFYNRTCYDPPHTPRNRCSVGAIARVYHNSSRRMSFVRYCIAIRTLCTFCALSLIHI